MLFHCTENHIFFLQASWKDGLSKKIALEYNLSCIIGKDGISFSQKYDLTPRWKMKNDLFQKNYMEIWYFFQMFWKDGLFKKDRVKKDRAGIWSFLYYLGTWHCFPENMSFFPWMENERERERDDLSQEIHGNMIFSI